MRGVLPYGQLIRLLDEKQLRGIREDQVKPASVDLLLDDEVYELDTAFLPPHDRLLPFLKSSGVKFTKWDFSKPLRRGKYYLIRLKGTLDLPMGIWGVSIIKSSLGRIDVHIRTIAESSGRFDLVPPGFTGKLWALVVSRSFNIRLSAGLAVTQLRLFLGESPRIRNKEEVERVVRYEKLIPPGQVLIDPFDGGIIIRAGLGPSKGGDIPVIWQAKATDAVLDLTVKDRCIPHSKFFKPIIDVNGKIKLKHDNFYIVSTREGVKVPDYLAAELVLIDSNLGEFRVNYPGFIDPGWGIDRKEGRQLTLDLKPAEDIVLVDGQPIAKLFLDTLVYPTEIVYASQKDAHYVKQEGTSLAKWFK